MRSHSSSKSRSSSPDKKASLLTRKVKKALKQLTDEVTGQNSRDKPGLRKVFNSIDKDKSGSLEYGEFKKYCKKLDLNLSGHDLEDLISLLDTDKSDSVSFTEFANYVLGYVLEDSNSLQEVKDTIHKKMDSKDKTSEDIEKALLYYDKKVSGYVKKSDFENSLEKVKLRLSSR